MRAYASIIETIKSTGYTMAKTALARDTSCTMAKNALAGVFRLLVVDRQIGRIGRKKLASRIGR